MLQKNTVNMLLPILCCILCLMSFALVFGPLTASISAQRFTSDAVQTDPDGKVTIKETKCEYGPNPSADQVRECIANNGIIKIINVFIALIGGIAGIAITGTIIAGGIQYSAAGGNQATVEKARKRISNAILALIAFIFLGAFLEWLVPGGLIR